MLSSENLNWAHAWSVETNVIWSSDPKFKHQTITSETNTGHDSVPPKNSNWSSCGLGNRPDHLLIHDTLDCAAVLGLGACRKQDQLIQVILPQTGDHALIKDPSIEGGHSFVKRRWCVVIVRTPKQSKSHDQRKASLPGIDSD